MSTINNGYISIFRRKSTLLKSFIVLGIVFGLILLSFIINKPNVLIYRFSSGLQLSLDNSSWKMSADVTTGSIFESTDSQVSILLTSAKVEDSSKNLTDIVIDRVSLLNQQSTQVKTEPTQINGIDFYKIDYKDSGDETQANNESSVSYATLYNGIYSTIQVYYKTGDDLASAMKVVNSVKTN